MNNERLSKKEIDLRQRVIALLTREQIEYLDKIGNDARFSTGKKITHIKIVSALVDLLMHLGVDGKGLRDSADLEEKIKNGIIKTLISNALLKAPANPPETKIETGLLESLKCITKR